MARSLHFQRWQADCIRHLTAVPGVSVELLIMDETPALPKLPLLKKLKNVRYLWWKRFSKKVNRKSQQLKAVDLRDELQGVKRMACVVQRKGKFSQYFTEADVQQIAAHELDLVLRFGFNIIRGKVLESARYGVWSFHHADELKYRGLPACFWEIYHGDPVTGALLQRLTDRLDGGIPLQKGYLKTNFASYRANREALYAESAQWPAQVVRELQAGITHRVDQPPSKTRAPIYRNPTNAQMLGFVLRQTLRKWRKAWRLLHYEPHWTVGVVPRSIQAIAEQGLPPAKDIQWLPEAPQRYYLADPFGFWDDGQLHVLAEQLDYQSREGIITESVRFGETFSQPRPVLQPGHHLSYPFLIQQEGTQWVLPEASQSGQLAAYPINRIPTEVGEARIVFPNFPAGDASVLKVEDRWWMWATDARDGANYKLHLFHSDSWDGPWRPHPGNPVKIDIRASRPAGTPFWWQGDLYRPAQDSSEVYGGRVRLLKINTLTPDHYEETEVARIDPLAGGPGPDGLHTLSAVGEVTLIDSMRYQWVWGNASLRQQRLSWLLKRG